MDQNIFHLSGIILDDVHEVCIDGFIRYSAKISILRKSHTADIVTLFFPRSLLCHIPAGCVDVSGEYLTYNKDGHLYQYALVDSICETDRPGVNEITLSGHICKHPTFRQTPMGRMISDVILAVDCGYGRAYIPCIFWGNDAKTASLLSIGDKLSLVGRIHSREYVKDGLSCMTNEVSVCSFSLS